ncbi:MAG: RNA-binding protein [Leifsonia sp.]
MLGSAVEHLVKGIVDHPDDVQVLSKNTPRGEVLEVRVNPEDLGRVIGRAGRTAKAVRTLVTALADGRRVRVDVVDTDSAR